MYLFSMHYAADEKKKSLAQSGERTETNIQIVVQQKKNLSVDTQNYKIEVIVNNAHAC